jgi:hypothetical protein
MLGDIKAIIGGSSKRRRSDDDSHKNQKADGAYEAKRHRKDGGGIEIRGRGHMCADDNDREDTLSKTRNVRKELFVDHGPKRGLPREHRDDERLPERGSKHRGGRRDGHEHHMEERTRIHGEEKVRGRRDVQDPRLRAYDSSGSDSDPLEDIIGPKPPSPVRRRGRGAVSGPSSMDRRFDSDYDPKADVSLGHDEEDDDWGSALEALRDRERWRRQGADRLRAAGFTNEQVKNWEKGDQKTESDVKWSKQGEERAWDRGKVMKDGF